MSMAEEAAWADQAAWAQAYHLNSAMASKTCTGFADLRPGNCRSTDSIFSISIHFHDFLLATNVLLSDSAAHASLPLKRALRF